MSTSKQFKHDQTYQYCLKYMSIDDNKLLNQSDSTAKQIHRVFLKFEYEPVKKLDMWTDR